MYYYVLGGIMENISIDICKKEIRQDIEDIERSYGVSYSLICKLLKYQEAKDNYDLEIEDEKIRENSKIYSLKKFKEKIKKIIIEYLEKEENQNALLNDVKKELDVFLFQVQFQFDNYLRSRETSVIFKKSGEKNSKEEIFQKMYEEARKADIVLEYIILRTKIKEIIQNILLISSIFEMEQIKNKFVKELENSQEKIDEVGIKIDSYNKKLSLQNSKLQKNNDSIKKQGKELKKNTKKIDDHDKRILEMMGIFLSIFSIIGLGIVGILNIQDNLPTNILLIMGSILIVITLLFMLIKYNSENRCKFFVIIIIGTILIGLGISLYKPTDKNWEEAKIRIESLEKRLDYEKRINELERKSK